MADRTGEGYVSRIIVRGVRGVGRGKCRLLSFQNVIGPLYGSFRLVFYDGFVVLRRVIV